MTNSIERVTVLGTGVLGSQIAFQSAFKGFTVTAYDINDEVLEAAKARFEKLAETYANEVPDARDGKAREALGRLTLTSDLKAAVADADLVIEAIPEILDLKRETYQKLGELAPAKTVFATNSSTLLPSDLKDSTGRPDKFLALHFANRVWQFNTAEIMGTRAFSPRWSSSPRPSGWCRSSCTRRRPATSSTHFWSRSSMPPPNSRPVATPTPAPWTTPGESPPAHRWAHSRSTTSSA